jgi:putative transposase
VAGMIEMYVHGVSTPKVSKSVEQLCISASAVSAVTKKLDDEVTAWRRRSLTGNRYRYLIIDAHYVGRAPRNRRGAEELLPTRGASAVHGALPAGTRSHT